MPTGRLDLAGYILRVISGWRARVVPGKCRSRGVESNYSLRDITAGAVTPARDQENRQEQPRQLTSPHRRREASSPVGTVPVLASATQALQLVRAGLDYLAAADATAMPAGEQARSLRALEQASSVATAARTSILGAFAAGQGYTADADYSPRAWLIHKTGVTRGAAVAYTAWVQRAEAHPRIAAELAAGQITESVARTLCLWTDKLPAERRQDADKILADAAVCGLGLADLAGLFAEMYQRSRAGEPDQDKDPSFEDRALRLVTTLGGAGVLHGDLSPECAAAVQAVLDALSAPRTRRTPGRGSSGAMMRCGEAMRRLAAAGMLPQRAGQPVKGWVHIALAELLAMDGSTTLVREWAGRMRAAWAVHRAEAAEGGGNIGAWLNGDAATAVACDAAMAPVVTGEVNPGGPGGPGPAVRPARQAPPPPHPGQRPHRRRRRHRRHRWRRRRRGARGHQPGVGGDRAGRDRQSHDSFTALSIASLPALIPQMKYLRKIAASISLLQRPRPRPEAAG